ncbi:MULTISPECIES: 50S ribosomal protein L31e [unclassified Methanopyrus]|uniref:50S ribosomal protein L31e n=1 Tax=unclassified Methanopyrus TaxID=2684913 RepID=UPI000B4B27B3|nr:MULTISPECIES: 50S ribosomal protein L31e [unclassified Methanopyrus]
MAEVVDERVYTVPLRDAKKAPLKKRAPRAVKALRQFIERHMKAEEVKIGNDVNEKIWERGIKKPPSKIRVRAVKYADGTVKVMLAE